MSWQRMARRQIGELNAPAGKKRVAADEERVQALARKAYEGRIDLARGAGVEDPDLYPDGARSRSTSFNVVSASSALVGLTSTRN